MDANPPDAGRRARPAVDEAAVVASPTSAALPLRSADYKVVFTDRMGEMRAFYGAVLGLPLRRELGALWVEFHVGNRVLALARRGSLSRTFAPPIGMLPLRLLFRVAPEALTYCAALLVERNIEVTVAAGLTNPLLHLRDPDGNFLEIHAQAE